MSTEDNDKTDIITVDTAPEHKGIEGEVRVTMSSEDLFLSIVNRTAGTAITAGWEDESPVMPQLADVLPPNRIMLAVVSDGLSFNEDGVQEVDPDDPETWPTAAGITVPVEVAAHMAYSILEAIEERGINSLEAAERYTEAQRLIDSDPDGAEHAISSISRALELNAQGVRVEDVSDTEDIDVLAVLAFMQDKPTPGCNCEQCSDLRAAQAAESQANGTKATTTTSSPSAALDGRQVGPTVNILGGSKVA